MTEGKVIPKYQCSICESIYGKETDAVLCVNATTSEFRYDKEKEVIMVNPPGQILGISGSRVRGYSRTDKNEIKVKIIDRRRRVVLDEDKFPIRHENQYTVNLIEDDVQWLHGLATREDLWFSEKYFKKEETKEE